MTNNDELERERFEAWAGTVFDTRLLKGLNGDYLSSRLSVMWQAWQASRAAIRIEIYDFDSFSPYDCGEDAVWTTELIRTLAKHGIIVKE